MAAAHQSALSLPPPANMERLPSIKELHFPYRSPPSQGANGHHNGQEHLQQQHARHENMSWSRGAPSSAPGPQHPPPMPPPPDHPRTSQQGGRKMDAAYAQTGHPYAPQQLSHGAPGTTKSRGDSSQTTSKRGRSSSTVSASSGRSPHTAYPQSYPQQPSSPFHQAQGAPTPQTPQEPIQQQSPYAPPATPYGYAAPPSQQMAGRQPYPAQAPPQHQQPAPRPTNPYHPQQPPHEQWPHSQPPPQQGHPPPAPQSYQQQHQPPPHFEGYTRTTPLVPASAEPRNAASTSAPPPLELDKGNRDQIVKDIVQHCHALLRFATEYAQAGPAAPGPQELHDMTRFAGVVVRLLEQLRDLTTPEGKREPLPPNAAPEESRAPKRPWEEMSREHELSEVYNEENAPNTAQQDMEIIRSKRATSSGVSTPGQPKSKYRKRSRATPPGKCHSCNIRETPEWRRGPDGARTLCNACGLHYAKLMRKRDKALGADGKPIPIDMQTLRASTASSRGNQDPNGESSPSAPPPAQQQQQQQPHHSNPQGGIAAPYEPPKSGQHSQDAHHHHPPPPHASQYHLLPTSGQSSPTTAAPPPPHGMMQPPPSRHPHEPVGGAVPPPPWYVPQGEQQENANAYARSSHPRGSPQ